MTYGLFKVVLCAVTNMQIVVHTKISLPFAMMYGVRSWESDETFDSYLKVVEKG